MMRLPDIEPSASAEGAASGPGGRWAGLGASHVPRGRGMPASRWGRAAPPEGVDGTARVSGGSATLDVAAGLVSEGPAAPAAVVVRRPTVGVRLEPGGEQQAGGDGREDGEDRDDPP